MPEATYFSWLEIVSTFPLLALHQNFLCKGGRLVILIQQFENNKVRIYPMRRLSGKLSVSCIYWYMNFSFLFYPVRSHSSADIFPCAQQPFPGSTCWHLLLTVKALTSSSSSGFCFCAFAPWPFPQQAREGAWGTSMAHPDWESDFREECFVLRHKYENQLFGYFWLYWSSSPGSRCAWGSQGDV